MSEALLDSENLNSLMYKRLKFHLFSSVSSSFPNMTQRLWDSRLRRSLCHSHPCSVELAEGSQEAWLRRVLGAPVTQSHRLC